MDRKLNGFNNGRDTTEGVGGNPPHFLLPNDTHSPKYDIRIERLDPIGVVTETIILSKRKEMDYQRFMITLYEGGEPIKYMMTPADGIVKL